MTEVDSRHFRTVLGNFTTGVTVISGIDGGQPVGLAVGSFASVSLDPPLVAFCPDRRSASWPRIEKSGAFCVNVLASDQVAVSNTFAGKSEDKFEGLAWEPAESGSPRLAGALAWIDCTIESVYEAGDHQVVIGRVTELDVARPDAAPLLFFRGDYGQFGEL